MTAPAAVSNATNAPASAPVSAPVTQEGPFGVDDALASISRSAIDQTLAEQAPPADSTVTTGEQPRGLDGKFVPREQQQNAGNPPTDGTPPTTATTDAIDPNAPETPEPLDLPDGYVAVAPVQGRELATAFKVLDHEGELDVPDLTIEFQANDKTRREPLDQVVRLAQRGVYNEEREQAVVVARQESQEVRQQNQQLLSAVQRLQFERERLLSSDEAYLTERARYEAENTPEARLARNEQERAQQEAAGLWQQARTVTNQYFESAVLPAVEKIGGAFGEVSADEIGARLVLLTNHLRIATPDGDTMIPPAKHQAVGQIIVGDLIPWARSLHESRDGEKRTQRETVTKDKQDAAKREEQLRVRNQQQTNLVGRQQRTRGGAANTGTGTQTQRQQKPIKTVEDAEEAALRDTLAAIA